MFIINFVGNELMAMLIALQALPRSGVTYLSYRSSAIKAWKNFERFSCTDFRTKFLSALKSLGANNNNNNNNSRISIPPSVVTSLHCNDDNFKTL